MDGQVVGLVVVGLVVLAAVAWQMRGGFKVGKMDSKDLLGVYRMPNGEGFQLETAEVFRVGSTAFLPVAKPPPGMVQFIGVSPDQPDMRVTLTTSEWAAKVPQIQVAWENLRTGARETKSYARTQ